MQNYPSGFFNSTPLTNFERNLNMRRFSLGNVNFQTSAPLKSELRPASPGLTLIQDPIDQTQLNLDQQNNRFNSILMTINSQDSIRSRNSMFTQQQEQQQQQQPSQDNLASYLRYRGLELNTNQFSPSQNVYQQQYQPDNKLSNNMRRRSVAGPLINTSLRPVYESRSSSPVFSYSQQQQQHQQQFENKLSMLSTITASNQSLKSNKSFTSKSRFRTINNEGNSFYDPIANHPTSSMNSINTMSGSFPHLDSSDEKLATAGNIFQRREDWSILTKLPVSKQNTIHIRLEDEGPFGNDETRCFVLSHFSSLNVKELSCVFCGCEMIVYDRFPLVDGTLFVSPHCYDKHKSIPAVVSDKEQFINAVCLKCLSCEKDHEMKCRSCKQQWSGGDSVQIGTLYKYDLFAAFPCCQSRLNCEKCGKPVVDLNTGSLPFFSNYSEEKECPHCSRRAFHFIKPLSEIFIKSACEIYRTED